MSPRTQVHPYYHSGAKRAFDLILSTVLLLFLWPLGLIISLIILIQSGYPVLYLQKRTGFKKKTFKIYKFRTMYKGAEKNQWRYRKNNQAPAPMYKNWTDPRFVGIGRWLSKTGLDELPQLINILKGEMSFVGPRPFPVSEAAKLGSDWNFRTRIKPGIFSQWSAQHGAVTLSEWKKLDQKMLRQGGLKYELQLIGETLRRLG